MAGKPFTRGDGYKLDCLATQGDGQYKVGEGSTEGFHEWSFAIFGHAKMKSVRYNPMQLVAIGGCF